MPDDRDVVFTWVAAVGLLEPRLDGPLRIACVEHRLLRGLSVKDRARNRAIFQHGVRKDLRLIITIATLMILCLVLATS